MRILILFRDSINNGSTRVRALQYVDYWKYFGAKVSLIQRQNSSNFIKKIIFYFRIILLSKNSDLIFVQKTNLPNFIFNFITMFNCKLVVDIDDAVWEPSQIKNVNNHISISKRVGEYFFDAVKYSDLVVCGSFSLEEIIKSKFNSKKIFVVPPSINIEKIKSVTKRFNEVPIIGWIGSEGNLEDLNIVIKILKELVFNRKAIFLVISSSIPDEFKSWSTFIPWSVENEFETLSQLDIGIMPLFDNARSRGRCGYKAIQYMSLGIPVVASPVGATREIVEDGVHGFLASSEKQWKTSLMKLIESPSIRQELGDNSKSKVCEKYSLSINSSILYNKFLSL